MSTDVPLRCHCGAVRGVALRASPRGGRRLVCYCDDCQAFAHFLAQTNVLDAQGGTDVFQTTPAQLRIEAGAEQLRCVRLSERGLLRWYTACCRTPAANTLASPRVPFVGVVHLFMDHSACSRDEALGPPLARIHGRFALGGSPEAAHRTVPLGLQVSTAGVLLRAWLAGGHSPSPFFDARTRAPVVTPAVLSPEERERLRERARGGLPA
jgi:hypothetical protein